MERHTGNVVEYLVDGLVEVAGIRIIGNHELQVHHVTCPNAQWIEDGLSAHLRRLALKCQNVLIWQPDFSFLFLFLLLIRLPVIAAEVYND